MDFDAAIRELLESGDLELGDVVNGEQTYRLTEQGVINAKAHLERGTLHTLEVLSAEDADRILRGTVSARRIRPM